MHTLHASSKCSIFCSINRIQSEQECCVAAVLPYVLRIFVTRWFSENEKLSGRCITEQKVCTRYNGFSCWSDDVLTQRIHRYQTKTKHQQQKHKLLLNLEIEWMGDAFVCYTIKVTNCITTNLLNSSQCGAQNFVCSSVVPSMGN